MEQGKGRLVIVEQIGFESHVTLDSKVALALTKCCECSNITIENFKNEFSMYLLSMRGRLCLK